MLYCHVKLTFLETTKARPKMKWPLATSPSPRWHVRSHICWHLCITVQFQLSLTCTWAMNSETTTRKDKRTKNSPFTETLTYPITPFWITTYCTGLREGPSHAFCKDEQWSGSRVCDSQLGPAPTVKNPSGNLTGWGGQPGVKTSYGDHGPEESLRLSSWGTLSLAWQLACHSDPPPMARRPETGHARLRLAFIHKSQQRVGVTSQSCRGPFLTWVRVCVRVKIQHHYIGNDEGAAGKRKFIKAECLY